MMHYRLSYRCMADFQTALAGQQQAIAAANKGSGALASMAPPAPESGIHWTRTGGKSWRVVIVR